MNYRSTDRARTLKNEIKAECCRRGISVSELAEMIGAPLQGFYQSLNRGSIKALTMNEIRKALDIDNDTWLRWSHI